MDIANSFNDLTKVIISIQSNFDRVCDIWQNTIDNPVNLKKKLVIDTIKNTEILDSTWKYLALVNTELLGIAFELNNTQYDKSCVNSRVKAQNSMLLYTATHIYFERGNFFFPWELQVWAKKDKENNLLSHKKYKQDYVVWENGK